MSTDSRIWVYQADRKFTDTEVPGIESLLREQCEKWMAHGQPLKASYSIRYNQFVILAVDESYNAVSGCSMDDSVRAVKTIGHHFGIDFFDRNSVAFLENNGVRLLAVSSLKQFFQDGIWNRDSQTFNNLVQSVGQLDREWIRPAGDTWLARYIPREALKH